MTLTTISNPKNQKKAKLTPEQIQQRRLHDVAAWIQQRISNLTYGIKLPGIGVRHCNTEKEIISRYRAGRFVSGITQKKMGLHFSNQQTFYFTGAGQKESTETLVMVDIDCHAIGTPQGAREFAEHLARTILPGLYFETSTNGKGVHGYVVLEKGDDTSPNIVNMAVKSLDRKLKQCLASGKWDVELVEVKGACPVLTWGKEKGHLKEVNCGTLAKLPREAVERFEELQGTTRLEVSEVRKTAWGTLPEMPQDEPTQAPKMRSSKKGSTTTPLDDDLRDQFKNRHIFAFFKQWLPPGTRAGRRIVSVEDVAILAVLLVHCKRHQSKNKALPTKWLEILWKSAIEEGLIDRPWCCHRYRAARIFLQSMGWLNIFDPTYTPHTENRDGIAAKWEIGEFLLSVMEDKIQDRAQKDEERKEEEEEEEEDYSHSSPRPAPRVVRYIRETIPFIHLSWEERDGEDSEATEYRIAA